MTDWQVEHGKVIKSFLTFLNQKSNGFILKGGTSLLMCYGLDRFSEDIDLDGIQKNIEDIVRGFCNAYQYSYRVAKDTNTVKRYMINYGNVQKPLKVEVSYRKKEIKNSEIERINGINVYNINTLCMMKASAYTSRDKIRDLYDICFICNNYFDVLEPQTKAFLQNAVEYKGIEQFDYILSQQKDELIDEKKLAESFLQMFDKLNLLYDDGEKKIIEDIKATEKKKSSTGRKL